jgi:predicted acyl esterase
MKIGYIGAQRTLMTATTVGVNPPRPHTLRKVFAAGALCIGLISAGVTPSEGATGWPGGAWTPPAATYGAAVDQRYFVTMSDGVQIAVDAVYPTNPDGTRATGPFPVLITQSPYGPPATAGNYFVQRGYIYMTMRVRGTSGSGGVFDFFLHDGVDEATVVQWATTYPNSTGAVGLHGTSWAALNQAQTIAALGPNSPVKAAQMSCMGAEFYRETYNNSGIPTQTIDFPTSFGGLGGAAGQAFGNMMLTQTKGGGPLAYYGDFWKPRSPGEYVATVARANVPILLWSSNNDIYALSSLNYYAYLQNAYAGQQVYGPMNKNIPPTPRIQINISQGGHCAGEDNSVQLQWFEQWLKGINTGVTNTAMPIHVYEVLSNREINTSHYPVVPLYTKYYLDNAGAITPSVPTGGGQETIVWNQPSVTGAAVQFDGPVLPFGGTLAGPMSASIYASSTTKNLELIATLQSVAANGTVTALTKGTILGSMVTTDPNKSWSDSAGTPILPYQVDDMDRYVPAGTVQRYDFWISPRFVSLPAGSKLRVTFTTQTPVGNCRGNLGVDACFYTLPQYFSLGGSQVTIYHGPSTPSSINLPLLPAGCWHYTDNPAAPTPSIPQWGPGDPLVAAPGSPCQL